MKKLSSPKNKQTIMLCGVLVLIPVIMFILLYLPGHKDEGEKAEETSISQPIPEADIEQAPEGKTDSYVRSGISSYWDSLEETSPEEDVESTGGGIRRREPMSVEDIFGDVRDGAAEESASQRSASSRGGSSGSPRAAQKPQAPSSQELEEKEEPKEEEQSPARIQVKRSGAISSLDDDVVQDLGNGISTLDGNEMWVQGETGKPYRCMFTRDEKVGTGQRIAIRLLEDLIIDGVHIPQNTHLQGVCKITDRMEISVTSLDMGGRILSFHFEAYDTDGGKGIYCSDLTKTKKEVTEQGISTAMRGLNSKLGATARDAANLGASIVRSKNGETTVEVPAGYTFYIVEETRY